MNNNIKPSNFRKWLDDDGDSDPNLPDLPSEQAGKTQRDANSFKKGFKITQEEFNRLSNEQKKEIADHFDSQAATNEATIEYSKKQRKNVLLNNNNNQNSPLDESWFYYTDEERVRQRSENILGLTNSELVIASVLCGLFLFQLFRSIYFSAIDSNSSVFNWNYKLKERQRQARVEELSNIMNFEVQLFIKHFNMRSTNDFFRSHPEQFKQWIMQKYPTHKFSGQEIQTLFDRGAEINRQRQCEAVFSPRGRNSNYNPYRYAAPPVRDYNGIRQEIFGNNNNNNTNNNSQQRGSNMNYYIGSNNNNISRTINTTINPNKKKKNAGILETVGNWLFADPHAKSYNNLPGRDAYAHLSGEDRARMNLAGNEASPVLNNNCRNNKSEANNNNNTNDDDDNESYFNRALREDERKRTVKFEKIFSKKMSFWRRERDEEEKSKGIPSLENLNDEQKAKRLQEEEDAIKQFEKESWRLTDDENIFIGGDDDNNNNNDDNQISPLNVSSDESPSNRFLAGSNHPSHANNAYLAAEQKSQLHHHPEVYYQNVHLENQLRNEYDQEYLPSYQKRRESLAAWGSNSFNRNNNNNNGNDEFLTFDDFRQRRLNQVRMQQQQQPHYQNNSNNAFNNYVPQHPYYPNNNNNNTWTRGPDMFKPFQPGNYSNNNNNGNNNNNQNGFVRNNNNNNNNGFASRNNNGALGSQNVNTLNNNNSNNNYSNRNNSNPNNNINQQNKPNNNNTMGAGPTVNMGNSSTTMNNVAPRGSGLAHHPQHSTPTNQNGNNNNNNNTGGVNVEVSPCGKTGQRVPSNVRERLEARKAAKDAQNR